MSTASRRLSACKSPALSSASCFTSNRVVKSSPYTTEEMVCKAGIPSGGLEGTKSDP